MTKFRNYDNERLRLIPSVIVLIPLITIILLIGNLSSQDVYSHANPTSYTPQSNSVVGGNGTLPEKVIIVFSERPAERNFRSMELLMNVFPGISVAIPV